VRYILTLFWQAAKPATADHCAALGPGAVPQLPY
jgi:hypothetical protein